MPEEGLPENTYKLVLTAAGEVRDADGNLLNQPTGQSEFVVTESEMQAILERETP